MAFYDRGKYGNRYRERAILSEIMRLGSKKTVHLFNIHKALVSDPETPFIYGVCFILYENY